MSSSSEGLPVGHRIDALNDEFTAQVRAPQGDDPRIGLLFAGILEAAGPLKLYDLFEEVLEQRPGLMPIPARGLVRTAIQKQLLRRDEALGFDTDPDLRFPRPYRTSHDFAHLIQGVLGDPANRLEFKEDLLNRDVQTNIADRGKAMKYIVTRIQDRFGSRPVNWLDVGSGRNHLLKKAIVTQQTGSGVEYSNTTFHTPQGRELNEDPDLSRRFDTALNVGGLLLGTGLGIDKEDPDAPGEKEWWYSSFYPSEYLDEVKMARYRKIEDCNVPELHFKQVDVSTATPDTFGDFKWDVISVSTMWYLVNMHGRKPIHDLLRQWVHPDGVIMHQDFAYVNPRDRTSLSFFKQWSHYTFRLIIEDMKQPGRPGELQEMMRWKNGRCEEATLSSGRLQVRGQQMTMRELLESEQSADDH